jgi:hypothetical protein
MVDFALLSLTSGALVTPSIDLPSLPPSPTPSPLNPAAFLEMDRQLGGYFDTQDIVSMLTHGIQWRIDPSIRSKMAGAHGAYSNKFPPGGEKWMIDLVEEGAISGHFRILEDPREIAEAVTQPIALILKSPTEFSLPSDPPRFRVIYDMAVELITKAGSRIPSVNDSTNYDMVPSPQMGYPSRIAAMLSYLAAGLSVEDRSTIHMAKLDLDQAYYHVWVHPDSQLLLAFDLCDKKVVHTGLPFGSCLSPSIYLRPTLLMWMFMLMVCLILISWYMDDAFMCALTYDRCASDLALCNKVVGWIGFKRSIKKSSEVPVQRLIQLGLVWDILEWSVSINPSLIAKIVSALDKLTRDDHVSGFPSRRNRVSLIDSLESLVGALNFAQQVIRVLASVKSFFIWQITRASRLSSECFQLPSESLEVIRTTRSLLLTKNSTFILCEELELSNSHLHNLASDASGLGFGAWGRALDGSIHVLGGEWSQLFHPDVVRYLSGAQSNNRELWAHLMMLDILVPVVLPNAKFILLETDNTSVVSWASSLSCHLTKDGSHIIRTGWLRFSGILQASREQVVKSKHLAGILNSSADRASRGIPKLLALVREWRNSGLTVIIHSVSQDWHPANMTSMRK